MTPSFMKLSAGKRKGISVGFLVQENEINLTEFKLLVPGNL